MTSRLRPAQRMASSAGALGLACAVGLAVWRTLTSPVPTEGRVADPATRKAAFELIARAEPSLRTRAAQRFPGHTWAQDEDFHAVELQQAMAFAHRRGVTVSDVLRAIDDGLRERWPMPPGATMKPTVVPCRPLPEY